jgi:type I restriction enzyme S subunit
MGWVWTRLGETSEINPKLSLERLRYDLDVSFLPMRSVEELTGCIDLTMERKLADVRKGYTSFVDGDLLFAKITPCMENGKVAIARALRNGIGFGSTEFHVIRLAELLPREFFFYFLIREELRKDAQRNMTGSAGQLRVPANYMQQLSVPLPPLAEQQRIVAKIEELFTELDAGVEALQKLKAQLKRYRQAVLKHAFEGKLTEAWREAHKGELEPASVLLERIRAERAKNANIGAHSRAPRTKAPRPYNMDTSSLPQLPEGWVWTTVEEITEMMQYGTSEKAGNDSSGIPVIRMGNIQEGKLVLEGLKFFPKGGTQLEDFVLRDGDLLFNRTNSAELVGKTAVYKESHPESVFASYLIRVRVNRSAYNPYMLSYFINSSYGRAYIASVVSQQVGQANVNSRKLSSMPIRLPPLAEQHQIVEEIERRFSIADEVEKAVEQSLKQAERLRQSILKRAFEGKLVPQDPNDEPANKLLERIKQAQSKNTGAQRPVPLGKKRQV